MSELRLYVSTGLKALSDFSHFEEGFFLFFSYVEGKQCLSNVDLILLME